MFSLLRLIIWIVGIVTVASFALPYFGYEPNWDYWTERAEICGTAVSDCRETLVRKGTDGALTHCSIGDCIDPRAIVRKR